MSPQFDFVAKSEHVQAIEIDTQTDFKLLIPSQIKREISIEQKMIEDDLNFGK